LFIFLVLLFFNSINLGKTIVIARKTWNSHMGNENKSLHIFINDIEMNNEPFEERYEDPQT
jgi:dihydrofolate reductase